MRIVTSPAGAPLEPFVIAAPDVALEDAALPAAALAAATDAALGRSPCKTLDTSLKNVPSNSLPVNFGGTAR